ncbi:MAG: transferase [Hyphomicrobium sp.]
MTNLVIRSRAYSSDLRKAACSIEQAAWNDLGYLNYTRAHYEHYATILEEFAEYQLCLVDEDRGYPVAVANCVPIACSGPDDLPPEGWDWLVERGLTAMSGTTANMLGALAISVPALYRSKGYARIMIQALLDLAHSKGLDGLVAPVRPSAKAKFPHVPIDDYITWTDDRGRPFDPWLRSHLAAGGKLIRPCKRSMVVSEHLGFWENWSKKTFDKTGDYEFEGALVPVHIDLERQYGCYEEPNVWVAYGTGGSSTPLASY